MCLCFVANEKGDSKIKLNFKDLEFLMGRIEKNPKRLFGKLDEFVKKAMKTIIDMYVYCSGIVKGIHLTGIHWNLHIDIFQHKSKRQKS